MSFNDIRPYSDEELNQELNTLINDPEFEPILSYIFKDENIVKQVKAQLGTMNNVRDFQLNFMYPLVKQIIAESTDGVTCSGIENLQKDKAYIFISNHRDIILDSAFMNGLMFQEDLNTTEIAIGSNLLIFDWITRLVRINRAFIVKRNIPVKQQLLASRELSQYIRHVITEKGESIWIAQREGRSKDGNDATQPALLKMLNMSNCKSKDFVEGFKELCLVPLAISYEIEPCGNEKVVELLNRSENTEFKKTPKDDLLAMSEGLKNAKGRVHFAFGKPITTELEQVAESGKLNDQLAGLASLVDQQIHTNYKLWPTNYIAYDILNNTDKYSQEYTPEQKEKFIQVTNERLEILGERKEAGKGLWMNMYANPVINKENAN
ncbi:glycerol acyltransferase [Prolixibacteraceae bacterium JC049]|nr:glycerol acyltransferase [Prolixibacteraceae bacterium JC049]